MELISSMIENCEPDIDLESFCHKITEQICNVYTESNIPNILSKLKENPEQRLTASMVIYSKIRNEIWMIGDCQCMVNGIKYDNNKPYENEIAKSRSNFLHKVISTGVSIESIQKHDIGRDYILDKLINATKTQNIQFAVIDGFMIPMDKIKTIHTKENDEIVLASDGYPFLMQTLESSEKELKSLLDEDPLCITKYIATKGCMKGNKSFDDRAYIRFIV